MTRILVLLVAAALTTLGARQTYSLWHRLPGPSLRSLDWDTVHDRQSNLSGRAREGFLLVILSEHFTDALHDPDRLAAWIQDARDGASLTPDTQVARLQLAALTMLSLENDRVPRAEWWLRLQTYLSGLDKATFEHFLTELIDAYAGIVSAVGVPPGTARHLALYQMGYKHGPFLQYFAAHMQALIGELRAAGDDEAATRCEQALRRLLRTWTLNPGPVGLRLLAADLLSDNLAQSPEPNLRKIADELRAWHAAYRTGADKLPLAVSVLRIDSEPTTADAGPLTTWLGLLMWTVAMLIVLVPVGLLGVALWRNDGRTTHGRWRAALLVLIPGLVVVAIGGIVQAAFPELVADDLLRLQQFGRDVDASQHLGPPHLLVASLLTALAYAAVLVIAGMPRAAGPRRTRLARLAALSWLSVSLAVVVLAFGAERARRGYETILSQSSAQQFEQIAGPNADAHLDALRTWHP